MVSFMSLFLCLFLLLFLFCCDCLRDPPLQYDLLPPGSFKMMLTRLLVVKPLAMLFLTLSMLPMLPISLLMTISLCTNGDAASD